MGEGRVMMAVAEDIARTVNDESYFFECRNPDYDIRGTQGRPRIRFHNRNMHALGTEIAIEFKKGVLHLIVTGKYRNVTKGEAPIPLGDPELGETVATRLDEIGLKMVALKRRQAMTMVKRTDNVLKKYEIWKEKKS
jgi:hypothetical protein